MLILTQNTWGCDCCPRYSYAWITSSGNGSSNGPTFRIFLPSLGICRTMLMAGIFTVLSACAFSDFCTITYSSPLS